MPRKPRCRLEPGVYHVLNRGINRGRVFEELEERPSSLRKERQAEALKRPHSNCLPAMMLRHLLRYRKATK